MSDTKQIYQSQADRYHTLVSREDYQGNLLPAILQIDPISGRDVLELGAGTGRLSGLIAPLAHTLTITDLSMHMLSMGVEKLQETSHNPWLACLAAHHALPFSTFSFDTVIAGWSFCYAAIHVGADWKKSLEQALDRVQQLIKPNGKLILIESLGTGYETPHPPDVLTDYLAYLDTHGFESTWIRTDYCFKNMPEALELTRFFFGDQPMPMQQTDAGVIVPECTGLWWKVV
jgi:ubiquinone/menaquinone biosynthesis C-methylase UbiE